MSYIVRDTVYVHKEEDDILSSFQRTTRRGRSRGDGLLFRCIDMARDFSKAFYKSADWARVRAYVLMRDHYKCTRCGQSGALEVHHIIHLTPDNINDAAVTLNDRNLTTLCRDCHFKEHAADKLNGTKQFNASKASGDCDAGFSFDENGYLVSVEK